MREFKYYNATYYHRYDDITSSYLDCWSGARFQLRLVLRFITVTGDVMVWRDGDGVERSELVAQVALYISGPAGLQQITVSGLLWEIPFSADIILDNDEVMLGNFFIPLSQLTPAQYLMTGLQARS